MYDPHHIIRQERRQELLRAASNHRLVRIATRPAPARLSGLVQHINRLFARIPPVPRRREEQRTAL